MTFLVLVTLLSVGDGKNNVDMYIIYDGYKVFSPNFVESKRGPSLASNLVRPSPVVPPKSPPLM